jgi:hypothetical protein
MSKETKEGRHDAVCKKLRRGVIHGGKEESQWKGILSLPMSDVFEVGTKEEQMARVVGIDRSLEPLGPRLSQRMEVSVKRRKGNGQD